MKKEMLLMAIITLIVVTGCRKNKENSDQTVYAVTSPWVTNTQVSKNYVANIESRKNIEVRAQQEGILQQVYVTEGQQVRAGQPLFRISIVGAQQNVARAKAEAEQARIELQNTTTLTRGQIVSPNAQKMAKAKLNAALADYKLAQIQARLCLISAPFTGVIGSLPKKIGSLVQGGDLLTTLSDNSSLNVYFNISEPEYIDYQQHSAERNKLPLTLILANGSAFSAKGYIQNIAGEFDSSSGNIALRARFANPKGLLRNGETGTVRINMPLHNVLVIPQQATYEEEDRRYVFVIDGAGYAHSREIKVAFEQPEVFIIAEGVTANDKILLSGVQKVHDGQHVKTRYYTPSEAMKRVQLNAD